MCNKPKKTLIISSKYRSNSSDSTYDFTYNNHKDIYYKYLRIKYVSLPLSFYNISAFNQNNLFLFNEGGGTLTATITDGIYSLDEYITELKTQLDAAGALTYTVVKSNTTYDLTISATGSFEIEWTGFSTRALEIFTNDGSADSGSATSFTAGPILLSTPTIINIFSTLGSYGQVEYNDKKSKNLLISAPISPYSQGEIFTYTTELDTFELDSYRSLSQITMQLRDENDNFIDLNGLDWIVSVEYW